MTKIWQDLESTLYTVKIATRYTKLRLRLAYYLRQPEPDLL